MVTCPLRQTSLGFLRPNPHKLATEFRLSPSRLRDWRVSSWVGTEPRDSPAGPAVKCSGWGYVAWGCAVRFFGLGMIFTHRLNVRKAGYHSCINCFLVMGKTSLHCWIQNPMALSMTSCRTLPTFYGILENHMPVSNGMQWGYRGVLDIEHSQHRLWLVVHSWSFMVS